jgi:hypothetical protein
MPLFAQPLDGLRSDAGVGADDQDYHDLLHRYLREQVTVAATENASA